MIALRGIIEGFDYIQLLKVVYQQMFLQIDGKNIFVNN